MRRSTAIHGTYTTRLRVPLAGQTAGQPFPEAKSQAALRPWSLDAIRHIIDPLCVLCLGSGRIPDCDEFSPCGCVFARIFAEVRKRFDSIRQSIDYTRPVRRGQTASSKQCWGMTNEEFLADFTLTARRHLTEQQYTLFRKHILLLEPGAPGQIAVIERILGRAYAEMRPYSLWPISGYFGRLRKTKRQIAAERLGFSLPQ